MSEDVGAQSFPVGKANTSAYWLRCETPSKYSALCSPRHLNGSEEGWDDTVLKGKNGDAPLVRG